jgi:hypothetical protein
MQTSFIYTKAIHWWFICRNAFYPCFTINEWSLHMDYHLQMAVAGSSEMLVTSYHKKWTQHTTVVSSSQTPPRELNISLLSQNSQSLRLKTQCLKIKNIWSPTRLPWYVSHICFQASVTKCRSKNCYIYTVFCSNVYTTISLLSLYTTRTMTYLFTADPINHKPKVPRITSLVICI